MYRNSVNVEYEMLCHANNHWGTGTATKGLKKYLETILRRHQ